MHLVAISLPRAGDVRDIGFRIEFQLSQESLETVTGPASGVVHLPEHRVILLTPDDVLQVINTQKGTIEAAFPVSGRISADFGRGLTAVQRNGRIFASVGNIRSPGSEFSADARYSFDRLAEGTLFCLDGQSQRIIWHQSIVACQMPQIHGDPTNLIVTWSWVDPNQPLVRANPRLRKDLADRRYRSLRISIRHPLRRGAKSPLLAPCGQLVAGDHQLVRGRRP